VLGLDRRDQVRIARAALGQGGVLRRTRIEQRRTQRRVALGGAPHGLLCRQRLRACNTRKAQRHEAHQRRGAPEAPSVETEIAHVLSLERRASRGVGLCQGL
jgi:hypothetical protein